MKMKARVTLIASIFIVLLIPAINAKPVIIGFTEEIDQNIIKETQHIQLHSIQYNYRYFSRYP